MGPIADEYEPLEVIGKGSFGTVRKIRLKADNSILVRKEIEYTSMNTQERNHIISELRILRELNHPHIVKYLRHDHLPEKKAIHIYQEFCEGGDLGKVISTFKRNKKRVPEQFVWQVLVETLLALHRCHYGIDLEKVDLFGASAEPPVNADTVIIHRDIKPENIFLHENTVKLGDFGLAKMLTSQNDFAKTYVGTPYYMSPEVLMDNPYLPVCDIWSLGCVLYELCNLEPPFQAKTHLQLQMKIRRGIIPEISPEYSEQLRNIIKDSITVDPNARPTCHDLLETLPVKMFRKEMELKNTSATLGEFHQQLAVKNDQLKKQESSIKAREAEVRSIEVSVRERELDMQRREAELRQRETAFKNRENAFDQRDSASKQSDSMSRKREAEFKQREAELVRKEADFKKKEAELHQRESVLKTLETAVQSQRQLLHDDHAKLQRQCNEQKQQLEAELLEDFEMRKRQMDQEAKDMRIKYQREFKHVVEQVVEQEVQLRLEMMKERQVKPRGPREFVEESLYPVVQQHSGSLQYSGGTQYSGSLQNSGSIQYSGGTQSNTQSSGNTQNNGNVHYSGNGTGGIQRRPLKNRNDWDDKTALRPMGYNNYRKRITDELELLTLQKRHVPEYEEQYLRQQRY